MRMDENKKNDYLFFFDKYKNLDMRNDKSINAFNQCLEKHKYQKI